MGVKLEDHIAKLLKRVDEWIAEQKEAASLEKGQNPNPSTRYKNEVGVNKPINDQKTVGISGQGYSVRGGMATISVEGNKGQAFRQPQGGSNFDRELARKKATNTLKDLKAMPKPNLPKSEPVEKAKIDEGKTDYQKQAARADRAGSWEKENLGTAGSGHSKIKEIAHFLHNSKLDQIKRSPKANLPVDPVDKSIEDQMFYEKHKKQIHQEGKARRAAIEQKKANPSLIEKLSNWVNNKSKTAPAAGQPTETPDKLAASEKTPIVMTAKQAVKEHKELVHVLKTPSHKDDLKEAKEQGKELKEYKEKLDKSAMSKKPHNLDLTHVATVETPKELHPFISGGTPVPYDHPHRELAAKFVTDVWRKNKPEGKRMSEKLLGIDENGKVNPAAKQGYSTVKAEKKFAAPTPADVSAPVIINERRTNTGRHYISGPDKISGYPNTVGMSGEPKEKEMKKSELAKSLKKIFNKELDKAQEKGVHQPWTKGAHESTLGYTVRGGMAPKSNGPNDQGAEFRKPNGTDLQGDKLMARKKATNTLKDLKAMPKPNLPKSEKSLEKLDPMTHQPGTMLDKSSPEYLYKMKSLTDGLKKCYGSKMQKANNFEAKSGLKGQDAALKMVRATNPDSGPKGVHKPFGSKDVSVMGHANRGQWSHGDDQRNKLRAKQEAVKVLGEMSKMPKPNLPKSESVEKAYDSKAQQRWAHTEAGTKALGGKEAVKEWNKESKGKNIPEKVTPVKKSNASNSDLKKNAKLKELEAKLNALKIPQVTHSQEVQAAAKAKVAASMQSKAKHDQMEKDRMEKYNSEQKLKQDLLLPENIKLDRPKYLTINQGHESILNGKPNPMQEAGKNKPEHLDDVKLLNAYHGRNIISGVHDQPVKSWGNETYLMHPDGKLEFQHAEYDTSDARK